MSSSEVEKTPSSKSQNKPISLTKRLDEVRKRFNAPRILTASPPITSPTSGDSLKLDSHPTIVRQKTDQNNPPTQFAINQDNLTTSNNKNTLTFEDDNSSCSTIASTRRTCPPVQEEITTHFKNTMVTDPTLSRLSSKAKQLILKLLEEIEDNFSKSRPHLATDQTLTFPKIVSVSTSQCPTAIHSNPTPIISHKDQFVQTDKEDINCQDEFAIALISKLDSLHTKIDLAISTSSSSPPTYAAAASSNNQPQIPITMPKSTIVLKPKTPAEINNLAIELQALPCPPEVKIKNYKILQDKIEIRADSEHSKSILKNYFQSSSVTKGISIEDKKPLTSKIILFNIDKDTDPSTIKESILTKLSLLDLPEFDVWRQFSSKIENKFHWVVTIPRRIAQQLIQSKFIFIGLRKVFLRKYVFVTRCTRCQRLNDHTASECQTKHHYCSSCGGEHHFTSCNTQAPSCINCVDFNSQLYNKAKNRDDPILQQLVNVYHTAASTSCPSYRYYFDQKLSF